jgi:N,N'-diacetyllegionaminate synthase
MKLIVEIGQAHDGSHGNLMAMVRHLCSLPVDVIKLQHHIADAESSEHEQFRKAFSIQDASRQAYWRRMELPLSVLRDVKNLAEQSGKEFLCTPFSMRAVDELESIGVARFKIGSADVGNQLLLRRIAQTRKPVIISSGTKDYEALDAAVQLLRENTSDVTIMHCTSAYPTPLTSVDLGGLDALRDRYGACVGLSDHSGRIWPSVFALAHGATHAEVHFAWSRDQFGPDSSSSLTSSELLSICEAIRAWRETHVSEPDPAVSAELQRVRQVFDRSVRLRADIQAGQTLTLDHVECFKPSGLSLDTAAVARLLGQRARTAFAAGTIFTASLAEQFDA